MSVQVAKRLLTVVEYYKMAEVGILGHDERTELIEGEIFVKAKQLPLHSGAINKIYQTFFENIGNTVTIGNKSPVRLSYISEPEPDISILHHRKDFYAENHPGPNDIFLLIEVALSTLDFDQRVKLPLYATAGIPECWIVNLEDNQVEVYRQPQSGKYLSQTVLRSGDSIFLPQFDLKIKVDDVMG